MGTVTTTDVVNGQVIDPATFNNNFTAVKAVINGGLDNTNIAASAGISPSKIAPGTDTQVLTTTGGVAVWADPASGSGGTGAIPVGGGMDYFGAVAPSGWLFADGSAVSRTTYASLFAAVGTTYGAGDGTTTFNLPDRRGRVSVMKGPNALVNTLGNNDGVAVANRRPQHRHTPHSHTITEGGGGGSNFVSRQATFADYGAQPTSSVDGGSGVATDSLDAPAYLVCNYIIYAGV